MKSYRTIPAQFPTGYEFRIESESITTIQAMIVNVTLEPHWPDEFVSACFKIPGIELYDTEDLSVFDGKPKYIMPAPWVYVSREGKAWVEVALPEDGLLVVSETIFHPKEDDNE